MLTIQDLADLLGTTVRGVRLRIELLDDLVSPHLHRGSRNEILVDQAGVALLQRLEQLRKTRQLPLRDAVKEMREELVGKNDVNSRESAEALTSSSLKEAKETGEEQLYTNAWALKLLIEELRKSNEELRRERDKWQELALRLQSRVEELERLALPAPKDEKPSESEKPWWARGIFRWLWG